MLPRVLAHPLSEACLQSRKPASRKAGAKSSKGELTEEQRQEIREAFDLFDTDGSGN